MHASVSIKQLDFTFLRTNPLASLALFPPFPKYDPEADLPNQACESLLPFLTPSSRVLDIGSGSGYLTHVLANLVAPSGTVIGVDHIQGLVDMADKNMRKSAEGRELLNQGRVRFVKADGRLGFPEAGTVHH